MPSHAILPWHCRRNSCLFWHCHLCCHCHLCALPALTLTLPTHPPTHPLFTAVARLPPAHLPTSLPAPPAAAAAARAPLAPQPRQLGLLRGGAVAGAGSRQFKRHAGRTHPDDAGGAVVAGPAAVGHFPDDNHRSGGSGCWAAGGGVAWWCVLLEPVCGVAWCGVAWCGVLIASV